MNAYDANMNYTLHNVTTEHLKLNGLLKKFQDVFSPEFGLVEKMKVHVTWKKNEVLKFFKAHPLPTRKKSTKK